MDYKTASKLNQKRFEIISLNRSRRLKKMELLSVPEKARPDLVPIAYQQDGSYVGRLSNVDECPAGCVIRFEIPIR